MKKIIALLMLTSVVITYATAQSPVVVQQTKIKKIVVTGSAEMEVEPDEIFVNFTLREYINSRKEKIGMEVIRKEFLEACSKAGVLQENIHVEQMAGYAYDWMIRKRKKDPDFVANITYVIKFSSTKIIDNLVPKLNDEAVSNMYVSKKTHSKMEEFRKTVKINATKAAKDKAQYLAEAVGEKLGGALLIEEIDSGNQYIPYMMKSANMAMEGNVAEDAYGGETSMPFQKIKIRFETRAEYELQ